MKKIRWDRLLNIYFTSLVVAVAIYIATLSYVSAHNSMASRVMATHLDVPILHHDFGTVRAGDPLAFDFKIRNKGPKRIVVNRASCGCADDGLERTVIVQPGETIAFPATLSTQGQIGQVSRFIELTTSDPKRPQIVFTISALVAQDSNDGRESEPLIPRPIH